MITGTFATAINCIDGRVQEPVISWVKKEYKVDFVDMVNEPGPDKIISQGSEEELLRVKNEVSISVNQHGSKAIVVVAHADCAGNPVSEEEHRVQVAKSVEVVRSWGFSLPVLGLWVGDERKVEVLCR